MPIEIKKNIYHIPAYKPACNCYLITGERNLLIDTSVREVKGYLQNQLSELNLTFDDIHDVIYTHCHYDHTGGGEFFPNATIYAHPLCKYKMQYKDETVIHALKYQVALPTNIPDRTFEHLESYKNGEFDFTIIHTPGHTDDGICIYEKNTKLMFTGDTIFEQGIPALITDSGSEGSLLYSVDILSQFDVELILSGHGKIDDHSAILKTKEKVLNRIQKTNKRIITEAQKCSSHKY